MGLLRVMLALAVLLEHTGGFEGYMMIGGKLAVQAFFIISGFYMGLVLNERYNKPEFNRAFYANRAIRIYAMYFVFLGIYALVFGAAHLGSGGSPLWPYFDDALDWPARIFLGLLNFTVIGQDIPLFLQIEDGGLAWGAAPAGSLPLEPFRFMLIPVAWSMSLELCFYAIAPFIARRPAWQIAALLAASLLARVAGAAAGLVEDPFTIRFFPFELALFLAGVLAWKAYAARRAMWDAPGARVFALAVPAAILAYPWLLGNWPIEPFFTPPRIGLLVLIAAALPAIHGWTKDMRRDRALGELSYPLYLGHMLVFGLLSGIGPMKSSSTVSSLVVGAVSLVLAWVVVRFVDQRIEAVRRGLAAKAGVPA